MNVVDSSAWLEYLAGSPEGAHFASAIEETAQLVVPVVIIYEVFKKLLREQGESTALRVVAQMQEGQVVPLTVSLSLKAAGYRLPMADSLIYATAQHCNAILWTQDAHFKDLPGVRYFPKQAAIC